MNKQNIPKLRFPEFKGEWEKKKLGEIAKFSKGKNISKNDISENGETECIRYGELYTYYGEIIDKIKSKTNIDVKDLVFSEANDVIIPASGETQIDIATASCVLKAGIALGGDLNIIKTENNGVFLSYYLNNWKKFDIANLAQGISVVHLYSSQLALLNLNFPSLPEQTRIATFFTVIDKKLSQLKQKKNLLEEYKKGLMQKLFSQELRFKIKNEDGELVEPPKWEKKRLGEVVTIKSGLSKDQNISDTGYRVTRIETISDGTINLEKVGFIEVDENIEDYKLNKGDILFSNINSVSHIGKTAIVEENLDLYHGMNLLCLRSIDRMNSRFLFYWLNTNKSRNYFKTICNQAVSQASINQTELAKTELQIPCEKEQTLIANFLTAIDKKIMHCEKQIEQTEIWKKGLLQKMFC